MTIIMICHFHTRIIFTIFFVFFKIFGLRVQIIFSVYNFTQNIVNVNRCKAKW